MVGQLMKLQGIRGAVRSKRVRTAISDMTAERPQDRVKRQFTADLPNQLWIPDFTYVSIWQDWLRVAFVTDVFARRIVGWRVGSSMTKDFVMDALEQALYARQLANYRDTGGACRDTYHPKITSALHSISFCSTLMFPYGINALLICKAACG